MIKKISSIILATIFMLILLYQLAYIRALSFKYTNLKDRNSSNEHYLSLLENMINNSILLENGSLAGSKIFDEDEKEVNKDLLFKESPVLVLRFSKLNCSDCVLKYINTIKEVIRKDSIKTIMISDYNSRRDLGLFKRMNGIKNHIYNCDLFILGEEQTPYFCIINEKGKVCNVFFPNDNFPKLTVNYLNRIGEKYFKSLYKIQ
jgi:hypothetical protein